MLLELNQVEHKLDPQLNKKMSLIRAEMESAVWPKKVQNKPLQILIRGIEIKNLNILIVYTTYSINVV